MVNYRCEKCGKDFTQKSHYDKHMARKTSCVKVEKLEDMVTKIVEKKMATITQSASTTEDDHEASTTIVAAAPRTTPVEVRPNLSPMFKWCGGKKDEIKNILPYMPVSYDTYLEPFIGGGGLFFHVNPQKAVIGDVHAELIDFYQNIKQGKGQEIHDFMSSHPNTEETYYSVRDDYDHKDALDNAKRFFYLRKTCFRGMLRYNKKGGFNIPFGRYKTYSFEELKNKHYETLLKNTTVIKGSFEKIFTEYDNENNFMFLDPPYDSEFTDYGYCSFGKKEHEALAACFKKTKIKCLMIIGKTDFISGLYNGYIAAEYDKKYRFKIHSGRVGDEIDNKHLVIKNY